MLDFKKTKLYIIDLFNTVYNLFKKYFDHLIMGLFFLLGIYLNWGYPEIAALLLFIWIIIRPQKSVLFAKLTIICLGFTPFFLVLKKYDLAETCSIAAFVFLGFAAAMLLRESKQKNF